MKRLLLLIVVALLVAAAFSGKRQPVDPAKPLIGGKVYTLVTVPNSGEPEYLDGAKWAAFYAPRCQPDGYRKLINGTTVADDLPIFKSMMADPTRHADPSFSIGDGKKIIHSEALPTEEDAAEKILSRYTK